MDPKKSAPTGLWRKALRIGVTDAMDRGPAKRVVLCNFTALLYLGLSLPFLAIFPLIGLQVLDWVLVPVLLVIGSILWMNKLGRHWASRLTLVTLISLTLAAFTLSAGRYSGFQFILITTCINSLILFDWSRERKSSLYGFFLTAALLVLIEIFAERDGLLAALGPNEERLLRLVLLLVAIVLQYSLIRYFLGVTEKAEISMNKALAASKAGEKAKSRFLANMSHEIRTPMNGIIGMARVLLRTELKPDQRDMGNIIQTSAQDLLVVLTEILDMAKIGSRGLTLEWIPFHFEDWRDEILRRFRNEASMKRQALVCLFEAGLPERFVGDPLRLKQVLANLLENAVKFTPEGGRIEVRVKGEMPASRKGYLLTVEVRDTGPGIPESALADLFQPFNQADGSLTRKHGGTGLGLALSRQIVERMGGRIDCQSREGRGSAFTFSVPLMLPRSSSSAGTSASDSAPGTLSPGKETRVLIVEDIAVNQKVLDGMLSGWGFRTEMALNGRLALEHLNREAFEVVFMDCHMPGMDGFDCTRRIRAAKMDKQPIIVGVTADVTAGIRDRCLDAGMDEIITKPIYEEELARILEERLGRKRPSLPPQPAAPGRSPAAPARSPTVDSSTAWVDTQRLGRMAKWMRQAGPGILAETEVQFRADAVRLLANLDSAAETGDKERLSESAHALKGLCLTMGLSRMAETCRLLERADVQSAPADWSACLQDLGNCLEPSLAEWHKAIDSE